MPNAPWIVITVDLVADYIRGPELNALRSAALASGQGDPLPTLIADTVTRVRNDIASCAANVLSETALSIPPELKDAACALVVEAAKTRLGLELSADQVRLANEARARLQRVSECRLTVTQPADPVAAPAQALAGTPRMTPRPAVRSLI